MLFNQAFHAKLVFVQAVFLTVKYALGKTVEVLQALCNLSKHALS
jgi:hypothetical protein